MDGEWDRLRELYREKSDEDLRELRADFDDLTEDAQDALRDEMRVRGIWEQAPTCSGGEASEGGRGGCPGYRRRVQ